MLKGIPSVISPDLMKILMEMGHGDEIVLADGNFPSTSHSQYIVRSDGNGIPELLEAILRFFPIDTYVDDPVTLMAVVPGDPIKPTIWKTYEDSISAKTEVFSKLNFIDRFIFYERAKKAFAVVATSETALYGNIILRKGVVKEE